MFTRPGIPRPRSSGGGCGAIRRSFFLGIGGFDAERFTRPSIEDIELGYRLCAAGHRVRLDRDLQWAHLKRWRLLSLIRTDVTCRALPCARLILTSQNIPDDLNLKLDGVLVLNCRLFSFLRRARGLMFAARAFSSTCCITSAASR